MPTDPIGVVDISWQSLHNGAAASLEGQIIGQTRNRGDYLSIQYLRGIAALMVVLYHIPTNRLAGSLSSLTSFGSWGVDVFFVISGFVMWKSSARAGQNVFGFILNRIVRIYPLYWVALTVWILARLVVPDSLNNADITARSLVLSYLLIPGFHEVFSDFAWPILTQGWTLQLEIFFYALVAVSLTLRKPAERATLLLSLMLLLVIAGLALQPTSAIGKTYTSILLVEFAGGICLALISDRLNTAPPALGAVMIAFGLALKFGFLPVESSIAQTLTTSIVPAILVVGGALILESTLGKKEIHFFKLLGDSSYSLYLWHTIAIATCAVIWTRIGLPREGFVTALLFFAVALVVSILSAAFIYHFIEKPLHQFGRRFIALRMFPAPLGDGARHP